MRTPRSFLFGLLPLLVQTTNVVGAAETESARSAERKQWRRELNGHLFIPSLTIPDPFLSTSFSVSTGAGAAWVDGPGYDSRANAEGRSSYVASALGMTSALQVNILDWWALRLSSGGGLFGGKDARSALVLGATESLGVTPGTTVSWRIGRFVRLGGTVDFAYEHDKIIDPLGAVHGSLLAGQADTSEVRLQMNVFQIIPGATVAFAPHRAIGLVASVQQVWLHRDESAITTVNYIVPGAFVQLDLRPLIPPVPLGIVAGYRAQAPIASSERVIQDFEGGLYYTGRDDLVLGVVVRLRWFDLRPAFDTTALLGNLVLRYYAVLVVILASLFVTPAMVTFFGRRVTGSAAAEEALGTSVLVPVYSDATRPLIAVAGRIAAADSGIVVPWCFAAEDAPDAEVAAQRNLKDKAEEWLAREGLESRSIFRVSRSLEAGLLQTVRAEKSTLLLGEWHFEGLDPESEASQMIERSPVAILLVRGALEPFERLLVMARRQDVSRPASLDLELAAHLADRLAHGRHVGYVGASVDPVASLFTAKARPERIESADPVSWANGNTKDGDLMIFAGMDAAREALKRIPGLDKRRFLVAIAARGPDRQHQEEPFTGMVVGRTLTEAPAS